ncbi:MAG: malonyl-CoA synthase [Pseudomonadota bacterium]
MTNPLYDTLFGHNANRSAPFLYLPDGSRIAYGDFLAKAAQFAHVLTDTGLKPGDRVAAQIEKSPEALALYAACVQAGAVFLPLNTAYTAEELAYFIGDSGAKIIVSDGRDLEILASIADPLGATLYSLNGDGSGTFADAAKTKPETYETAARGEDDLAALLYTSGTTGRSKGAMLSQRNLLSNAETLAAYWQFNESDILLHALPIYHTHGLFVATNITLIVGSAMIFLPKFDLDGILTQLPHATVMMGVPTFYTRLLDASGFSSELVRNIRLFVSGSAPLLAETHRRFETLTGHLILERYGMTETSMNTSNPFDGARRAGTVGLPLPGIEVKVTDPETGQSLLPGEIGQIEVRGPNVFQGYWQMPEKTKAELRENGFFITGDLGQFDEDGYLQIVGRDKDLIISGGFNIYPKEIELVLDAQPGVMESAVIGVPHADFGETVLALIVPDRAAPPDLGQIMSATAKSLARFKHPRELIFVEGLPRNTMGKVQKNLLRDRYKDHFVPT